MCISDILKSLPAWVQERWELNVRKEIMWHHPPNPPVARQGSSHTKTWIKIMHLLHFNRNWAFFSLSDNCFYPTMHCIHALWGSTSLQYFYPASKWTPHIILQQTFRLCAAIIIPQQLMHFPSQTLPCAITLLARSRVSKLFNTRAASDIRAFKWWSQYPWEALKQNPSLYPGYTVFILLQEVAVGQPYHLPKAR